MLSDVLMVPSCFLWAGVDYSNDLSWPPHTVIILQYFGGPGSHCFKVLNCKSISQLMPKSVCKSEKPRECFQRLSGFRSYIFLNIMVLFIQ